MVKQEEKPSPSRVSRSKSFTVRRSQEKNDSGKEEKSKLFAPTKSWLQYLNERKGIIARRETSSSFSKRTPDRAGSPQGRMRAAKKEESTSTTDSIQVEKKETVAKKSLASNGKRTPSEVEMKNSPQNKVPQVAKKINYPSLKRNTSKVNKEKKDVGVSSFTQLQTGTSQTANEDKKVCQQSKEGGEQRSNGTTRAAAKVIEKVKSQISQVSQKKKAVAKVDAKQQSVVTKKSQLMKSSVSSDVTKSTKSSLKRVETFSNGCNGVTSKNKELSANGNGDVILREDKKHGAGYDFHFTPAL